MNEALYSLTSNRLSLPSLGEGPGVGVYFTITSNMMRMRTGLPLSRVRMS